MDVQAGSRHLEILLLNELSSGTFARLYLAEARAPGGLDRIVAVKILREQWNESDEVINRTRDEARLLARLRHKNILRVEDLSEIDGQLAIIMEFVDGLDLKQLVEALAGQGRKVPARAALQLAAETASALEAAYFKVPYGLDAPLQVVHRDIKPSNVMVSVEGEVKVLDFGTARSSQAFRSVQTGALRFGSLKYMSPERREGDRGEHSADVYALGLMLVEILKGAWLPLLPMDPAEHDEAVAEEVAALDGLGMPNREWDVALRQVLLQALAGEASQRPNAEQVAKLLRAFAEQASGDSLDTYAREVVAPLTRQVRGNLSGGALAGTRFVVNNWSPDGRGTAAGLRPPASPPPQAVPLHQAAQPQPQPQPQPQAEPRMKASPTYAELNFRAPQPGSDPTPPEHPQVEVSHVASTAPPPRRAAQPAATGGGNGMAIVAGGAFVVVALLCAGVLGAGGVWAYLNMGAPATPAVATPTPAEPAPAATAPVSVRMDGPPVQSVRLTTAAGQAALSGRGELSGSVAPGAYELSLKLVGKPAIKGSIDVPAAGMTLVCKPGKDNGATCEGGQSPVALAP